MRTPPEAYLIFKEELRKARLEKEKIKQEYDKKLSELTGELEYLKEQLSSQRSMLKHSIEYANRLEDEIDKIEKGVEINPKRKNYH